MGTLIERYDRFVFDLDGTLWLRFAPLPFAREVMDAIRRRGKRVVFLTNSGALSGRQVAEALCRAGIPADAGNVITSGRAARRLLDERGMQGRKAFVVGTAGLIEELSPLGLELLGVEEGERAAVVVVTRDEEFTYAKLRAAARAVASGALFVATNVDCLYPVEEGFWPGSGALVAAVQAAAGGIAPVVAGKPERPMLEEAAGSLGVGGETLLVGDSPVSDLESARRMGWAAALVLTGKIKPGDRVEPAPDFTLAHLGLMLKNDHPS
jgi:HAD superfamily hydrolase (TIGR01450 family)